MHTSLRWTQVGVLLDEAMALPASERASFIANSCSDPELRRSMDSLVLSFRDNNSFLENPAPFYAPQSKPAEEPDRSFVGRQIGPYRLIEQLGSGGMGVVYRALRADENYLQSVAIKLMRSEFGSKFSLARFRVERQIMASLEHPNIARLLDGGTTNDGIAYLVMELIDGLPVDQYCDQHRLSIPQRLALFRDICAAVQFAHQHLVIHRDLKPANVVVTADGILKLLDFGIAKILDPTSFPEVVEPTIPLMRLLSPDYASPEQVRGRGLTPASDVYSLGVLLYGLLTGQKPYKCSTGNLAEYVKAVCELAPRPPSQAISIRPGQDPSTLATHDHAAETIGELRSTEPMELRRALEGDLDSIVLKALSKEPENRYTSVEQLSADIARYLSGLPINAPLQRRPYSASIGRRRMFAISAPAIGVCIMAAVTLAFSRAKRDRAERSLALREIQGAGGNARSCLLEIVDYLGQLPPSVPGRQPAIERTLNCLQILSKEMAPLSAPRAGGLPLIRKVQSHCSGQAQGARTPPK